MSFNDSPAMHCAIDKLSTRKKQNHSCCKVLSLIFALVSYGLAFTSIIIDLFLDNKILGSALNRFHSHTIPLLLPKNCIAPIWMTIYGLQAPWLCYTVTTLCRRNSGYSDSDYLYKYPRPVSQMQLFTFSLGCWSHLIFLFLIQHQSNCLSTVYIILGAMALTFCLITSLIHLHNYERDLVISNLFADIWSIRIFVHNGLSIMLAWQIALIGYSSLHLFNTFLSLSSSSKEMNEMNVSTLNLIAICLMISICIIAIFYIIIMSSCFSNTMCHVISGWIFLGLLIFIHWYDQHHRFNFLLLNSFYVTIGLISFILCVHLIFMFYHYCDRTCRSMTNSNRYNYRHDILQGKD